MVSSDPLLQQEGHVIILGISHLLAAPHPAHRGTPGSMSLDFQNKYSTLTIHNMAIPGDIVSSFHRTQRTHSPLPEPSLDGPSGSSSDHPSDDSFDAMGKQAIKVGTTPLFSGLFRRAKPVYKILESLPLELVEVVVSQIEHLSDLLSLARVNRLFQELAEPRIYAHVLIRNGSQARKLGSAISSRPIRATWIRSLQDAGQLGCFNGLAQLPDTLPSMTGLKELLVETPDCNSSSPNERIPWVSKQNAYSRLFARAAQPSTGLLPRLLSCTLHFVDDTRSLYPLAHHSVIFLHPTLTSLTISCASIDPPTILHPLLLQPGLAHTTPLTSLSLIECDIHPQGLYHLLHLPRELESLHLTEAMHHVSYPLDQRYSGLDTSSILLPIATIQPQLSHLTIARARNKTDHLFSIPRLDLSPFAHLHSVEHAHIQVPAMSRMLPFDPELDYCQLVHRVGPVDTTGGPNTATLVYSDIPPLCWEAGINFFACAFRNKISHGIEHLRTLKLILQDQELILQREILENIETTSPAVHRRLLQARDWKNAKVAQMKHSVRELGKLGAKPEVSIRLVVEWITPNTNTIPPYLVGEYVPVISLEYDNQVGV